MHAQIDGCYALMCQWISMPCGDWPAESCKRKVQELNSKHLLNAKSIL
jgi:hypothetical protein